MCRNDYIVFILSHGRPNNIKTINSLQKFGYTGKYYIVVDDTDISINEYIKNFGKDSVIVFNKASVMQETDTMNIDSNASVVLFQRNACFDLQKKLGYKYFLELDDDYTSFEHRWAEGTKLKVKTVDNLDVVFSQMFDFLDCDSRILSVALQQGGDFIGGVDGTFKKKCLRKQMNSFFCSTDKPFKFIGLLNEDVNTYVSLSAQGNLFLSPTCIMLQQMRTQKQQGGMSDQYAALGTYVKSFYTVMLNPSAVCVYPMGTNSTYRLHHRINWNKCAPKIISEQYRKIE